MSQKQEPRKVDLKTLTYNDYLKIPELLTLQKPLSQPVHHDEMLFIIIHQAYELWFKIILHELETARQFMIEKNVLRARHFVSRVVEIMKVLVQQIDILETMTPSEFLKFRDHLNPASGFQSLQFRETEFILGLKDDRYFRFFEGRPEMIAQLQKRKNETDLRQAYYGLLYDMGFDIPKDAVAQTDQQHESAKQKILSALRQIYLHSEKQLPLYLLSESLVDLDEQMILWRMNHVIVVERVIGRKYGTGGSSGVEYLKSRESTKCFPLLWEVRTCL